LLVCTSNLEYIMNRARSILSPAAFAVVASAAIIVSQSTAQPPPPLAESLQQGRAAGDGNSKREPGYLGLIADDRREQGQGVRVVKVAENGPAATAGLKIDDVILAIDGKQVGSIADMAAQLKPRGVDETVRFEIRRRGATETIEVKLGSRPPRSEGSSDIVAPPPPSEASPLDSRGQAIPPPPLANGLATVAPRGQLLGIRTATVTEQVRQRLRLPEAAGALVVSRVVGSPADKAGVPLDSVIVAADGQAVSSPTDLARLIAAAGSGKDVELNYFSGGARRTTMVTLADVAAPPRDAARIPPDPPVAERVVNPPVSPPISAAERIDQLERRVKELEQRLERLERAVQRSP
jgi:S1-C subfamily serine protease